MTDNTPASQKSVLEGTIKHDPLVSGGQPGSDSSVTQVQFL